MQARTGHTNTQASVTMVGTRGWLQGTLCRRAQEDGTMSVALMLALPLQRPCPWELPFMCHVCLSQRVVDPDRTLALPGWGQGLSQLCCREHTPSASSQGPGEQRRRRLPAPGPCSTQPMPRARGCSPTAHMSSCPQDYWVSLLYKRLVGPKVLAVHVAGLQRKPRPGRVIRDKLRIYAHCASSRT